MAKFLHKISKLKPTMDWIVTDDDPRIRMKAEPLTLPLTSDDLLQISKMVSYVDASYDNSYPEFDIRPGVAIASVQINWLKQVIYVHFDNEYGKEKKFLLANPEIIRFSDDISYLDGGEGCLSVPEDRQGIVPRKSEITVKAYDLIHDREIVINEYGLTAIVLQHEIDHLSGILYYDHINVLDNNYVKEDWKKI